MQKGCWQPRHHLPELQGPAWAGSSPQRRRTSPLRSDRRGKEVGELRFRKTWDIIEAVERGLLPDKVMLNVHPQRWNDRFGPWVKELVWQNVKNVVKRVFV